MASRLWARRWSSFYPPDECEDFCGHFRSGGEEMFSGRCLGDAQGFCQPPEAATDTFAARRGDELAHSRWVLGMEEAVEAKGGLGNQERTHATRMTILLAESCREVRYPLRAFLEASGYRVVEAVDGVEAVVAARRERPDLFLPDLSLPLLDGYAAAACIRKQAGLGDVPLVAVSAYASPEIYADISAAGFGGYILRTADFRMLRPTRV